MRRSFGILTDDRLVSYSDCINKRSVRKVHYNRSLSYVVLVALIVACLCRTSARVWGTRHHCYMLHVTCYVKDSPTSASASGAMAWRASSHITMPAVTLTLRECFVPNCGISRQPSHASTTSWWTPFTSLPKTTAVGTV